MQSVHRVIQLPDIRCGNFARQVRKRSAQSRKSLQRRLPHNRHRIVRWEIMAVRLPPPPPPRADPPPRVISPPHVPPIPTPHPLTPPHIPYPTPPPQHH